MKNDSGVGGTKGGKLLKSILKKTNYTPLINIAAATNEKIVSTCMNEKNVTHGPVRVTRIANDGMHNGVVGKSSSNRRKVSIANDDTNNVWKFDTEFDGVRSVAESVGNVNVARNPMLDESTTDILNNQDADILYEHAADMHEWDTFVKNYLHVHGLGVIDGKNMEDSDVVDAKVHQDQSDWKHESPGAFIRVDFRALVNKEMVENADTVLRMSPIEKVKNGMDWRRDEVNKVSVWIKMYNVLVVAYSADGLSLIATQIGKPVILDAFTSSMCEDAWGWIGSCSCGN
nr:zinc knuckle CX2CX4HX4C [Tanacetum cinerariifolium]